MKFLLLEDRPIVRLGLSQVILRRWPDTEIFEAGTVSEAVNQARKASFDIIISDLNLSDAKGLESIGHLLHAAPDARVLVLSLHDEAAYASRALQMGAYGYLEKCRAPIELISALETILSGQRYLTASQADRMARQMAGGIVAIRTHEILTTQEHKVMLLLADGMPIINIAERMKLSPKTVTTYRARLMEKLQLKSNSDLVRYCIEHALLK